MKHSTSPPPTWPVPQRPGRPAAWPVFLATLFLLLGGESVQAQSFNGLRYTVYGESVTITGFDCASSVVVIPDRIAGLPVTSIRYWAFSGCTGLTSVTIGNSVTSIGQGAFWRCSSLTSVTIPNSVTSIGEYAFYGCTRLTAIEVDALNPAFSSIEGVLFNKSQTALIACPGGKAGSVTIPNSVTSIEQRAFVDCRGLTSVTIPNSVTSIGDGAFAGWRTDLTAVHFEGNAPSVEWYSFENANNAVVYYLPGTTGWGATFGRRPTALWQPQVLSRDATFGVQTKRFGFTIAWAADRIVVVEACTDLAHPVWSPVGTNTLTGGSAYFSDPQAADAPARFYRLRSP